MGLTITLVMVFLLVCLFRDGLKTILEFLCLGLFLWAGISIFCKLISLMGFTLSVWGVMDAVIIFFIICAIIGKD